MFLCPFFPLAQNTPDEETLGGELRRHVADWGRGVEAGACLTAQDTSLGVQDPGQRLPRYNDIAPLSLSSRRFVRMDSTVGDLSPRRKLQFPAMEPDPQMDTKTDPGGGRRRAFEAGRLTRAPAAGK